MLARRLDARGFTLIELMISLLLVAILAMLALPAFGKLIGRTQGQAARSELEFSLNQARMTAVSRNGHIVACPSLDLRSCLHTTQWHNGWLLFADLDHDGQHSADEPVIAENQAQPEGVGILGTAGRPRIDYQPDGSASGTNITLTVCDRHAGPGDAATLVINQSGRVRHGAATPAAASACIDAAG
jgi:type IV fimbrial biogenesis protein FimT